MKELTSRLPWTFITLLCYSLTNSLFVYKYAPDNQVVWTIVYFVIIVMVYYLYIGGIKSKLEANKRLQRKIPLVLAGIILALILVIKIKLPASDVKVDRWSALFNWSHFLFQGRYPYAAQTHLGQYASPFPVWEVLHMPFYLLGDEIWAHGFMLLGLLWFLSRYEKEFDNVVVLGFLLLSPCYWWEVAVRSDLMNNLIVSVLFITICEQYFREKKNINYSVLGALTGLLLCTRLFLVFPFGIYFISRMFLWEKKSILQFVLFALSGFLVPMIPFIVWNKEMFLHFQYAPIFLQTQFGNPLICIVGIVFLALCSFSWKTYSVYIGLVGWVLFAFSGLRLFQEVLEDGWLDVVYKDRFDLSYMNPCIPFCVLFLSWQKSTHYGLDVA